MRKSFESNAPNGPWIKASLVRSLARAEMMQASLVEAMQHGLQNLVGCSSGTPWTHLPS